jgi:flagellar basal body-associated protein FliL
MYKTNLKEKKMQQNQLIILVILLAVVIVAIVAVVLLMGGGDQQMTPYPGTAPQTGVPTTGQSGPTMPPTSSGSSNAQIANAMASGSPVSCTFQISSGSEQGTATLKMEAPKMRMEMSSMGDQITALTPDGQTVYMYMAGQWYVFEGDAATVEMPDPSEVEYALNNPGEGISYNCQLVGDIPDSEFQLPPGVTPIDMANMYGDPSMYEGMYY